jgi:hypothetical protein
MPDLLQSGGNLPVSERRAHWRQKVTLSYVELGTDNGGVVLNVSQGGLALQVVGELIDDELPKIRLQFAQSRSWVEARGRITWRSDSKKMAGVQFIDLADESCKQIRTLLSTLAPEKLSQSPISKLESGEPSGTETQNAETVSTATGTPTAALAATESVSHSTSSPLVLFGQAIEYGSVVPEREQTTGSRNALNVIGSLLAAVLFFSATFFGGYYLGKTGYGTPRREVTATAKAPVVATLSSVTPIPDVNPEPQSDLPGFVLQVGAMAQQENADILARSLRQKNFPTFVSKHGADRFYRVFVGPYSDADSALKVKEELGKQGFEAIRTKWVPSAE